MASEDRELEEQLMEAGKKLLDPPPSRDELLSLLDQVENCLTKVAESPTDTVQLALAPSVRALIADKLFRHMDVDVKVAVASCISEITRITAPQAPYNDDQMKDVFQLIVSSFENLDDKSSPSYVRRTMILDTISKVRTCVMMLDCECNELIVEMFQLFLNLIRDYHPENVFSSMETIMTLVLEESEDVSVELLSPLLASVKRNNEEVLPIAQKLGEKVLKNCASKVEPHCLINALRSLGMSLEECSNVVTSICPKLSFTEESNDGHAAVEKNADGELVVQAAPDETVELAIDDSRNVVLTNGLSQLGEEEKLVVSTSSKNTEDEDHADQEKHIDSASNAEPQNLDTETTKETDDNLEHTSEKKGKEVTITKIRDEPAESSQIGETSEELMDYKRDVEGIFGVPCQDQHEEAASEKKKIEIEPSSPKAVVSDSGNFVSPAVNESLCDETVSKKAQQSKKGILIKDSAASGGTGPENTDVTTDSDVEQRKCSGKTGSAMITDDDKTPMPKDLFKKQRGTASIPDGKSMKQLSKKVTLGSSSGEQLSLRLSDDKKLQGQGKAVLVTDVIKNATKVGGKEKISSLKFDVKPNKDDHTEETSESVAWRKHIREESRDYAEEVVGKKIKVWWPLDRQFYKGKIDSFDNRKKRHRVVYDDGDVEVLNLKREKFEFIGSNLDSDEEEPADDSSTDEEADMTPKKNIKTNSDQSKRQAKIVASPKQSGASFSKAKSGSAKSGQKSKEYIRMEGRSVDGSKASRRTEDDAGTKDKDHNPKTSHKSADASKSASKTKGGDIPAFSGKSKDDFTRAAKASKSKLETARSAKLKLDSSKASPSPKVKLLTSRAKPNNSDDKLKSVSKDEDTDEDEDSQTDSDEVHEIAKGKVAFLTKEQRNKSVKKRNRGT